MPGQNNNFLHQALPISKICKGYVVGGLANAYQSLDFELTIISLAKMYARVLNRAPVKLRKF
jgi:hypothetical protein